MAEEFELRNLDNPYDDGDDVSNILNESTYNTVSFDDVERRLKALRDSNDKKGVEELNIELKAKITTENLDKLKTLIQKYYPNINVNIIELETKTDLRKRLLNKDGDLYLRTTGARVNEVRFGNHKYKAIKITDNKGETLNKLSTLQSKGMSTSDPYYKLLNEALKIMDDQGNIVGNIEAVDRQIDSTETVRKQIAFAYDDMTITSAATQRMEEPVRPLLESAELSNVLDDEDRQKIVKYLDFVKQNYNTKIKLLNDIEYNKKELDKAEKQLSTESSEDQRSILRKLKSDCAANIQSSKQMLDQILAYNERQYEDINTRLKSKFTFREKLSYIFRKYGLTITAITLALGLVIDTIVTSGRGSVNPSGNNNIPDKIKQSLKNFSNWLLEMSKKALDNLPAIIGNIISFLLKVTASIIGFLAEHLILFVIAVAFALYEALKIGYNDIKKRKK